MKTLRRQTVRVYEVNPNPLHACLVSLTKLLNSTDEDKLPRQWGNYRTALKLALQGKNKLCVQLDIRRAFPIKTIFEKPMKDFPRREIKSNDNYMGAQVCPTIIRDNQLQPIGPIDSEQRYWQENFCF